MNAKNVIGGFIAGAALGIAAGLLLAPASGERTRRKLVKGSMKVKNNVVDYVETAIESLREQFNDKIERVAKKGKEVVAQGKEVYNHVSERAKP